MLDFLPAPSGDYFDNARYPLPNFQEDADEKPLVGVAAVAAASLLAVSYIGDETD